MEMTMILGYMEKILKNAPETVQIRIPYWLN